jgi:hypothetical protein
MNGCGHSDQSRGLLAARAIVCFARTETSEAPREGALTGPVERNVPGISEKNHVLSIHPQEMHGPYTGFAQVELFDSWRSSERGRRVRADAVGALACPSRELRWVRDQFSMTSGGSRDPRVCWEASVFLRVSSSVPEWQRAPTGPTRTAPVDDPTTVKTSSFSRPETLAKPDRQRLDGHLAEMRAVGATASSRLVLRIRSER